MAKLAPRIYGDKLKIEGENETLQAIAAKSDAERLEDALKLVEAVKRRVAEAYANGEVSDADYEEMGDHADDEAQSG